MALVVQTNVPALNAQRHIGQAQNSLSKSIQRLSSGLRINSAADDASGLSIAEQIKGQIVGYERAYLNVQDGLSMLQVADGALGEINSMLQRLRELSVQAANGIYNANDIQYIQQEVDELKNEINRAAYAAEFNTRKLLDGSMTALWTSDNPNVDAVVNGAVRPGNYRIELNATPGQNAIYQTSQLQYANNMTNVNIIEGQEAVSKIQAKDMPETNPITGEELTYNLEIENNINNGDDKDKVVMAKTVENMQDFDDSNKFKDVEVNRSGYLLVEFNQGYPEDPEDGQEYPGFVTLTWYDANSDFTESVTVPATYNDRNGLLGTELFSYADDLEIDLTALSAFDEGTLDIGGEEFDRIQAGDKVLYSVSDRNSVDDDAGPEEFTVKLQSISNPDVTTDIQFNQLSGTNQTFQQVEMDENGNVWTYKYNVQFAALEDDDYNISFNVQQNQQKEIVDYNTQLGELAQFVSSDGSEAFATSKDLTIYGGNGQSATIHLSGSNTVKELEDKLTQALISMGYGSIDPTINERLVTFVTPENQSMFGNNVVQPGSFVIQTPTPGAEGQLYFSGDEELISGLAINNIRESQENVIKADVYDSYTNELIGSEVVKDNTMKLIPGVDVLFGSSLGLREKWENGGIAYEPFTDTIGLHLVDNRSQVQVGANAMQSIQFTIPQIDTTALGIDDLYVTDPVAANDALYKLDAAQYKLNSARSLIGAQMNRMEHVLSEIEVTNENMTAAESRIRDLDMAKEMTIFTKNQILSQTATAMLAQANMMPQLVLQLLGA